MPANKKQFYAILLNISAIYSHLFLLFGVRTNFRAMIAYAPQPKIVAAVSASIRIGFFSFLLIFGRPRVFWCASKCNASPIGVKLECHTRTLRLPVECRCLRFDWLAARSQKHAVSTQSSIQLATCSRRAHCRSSVVGLTNRLANRDRECDAVVHVICLSIRYSRRAHHFSHSF